MRKKNRGGTNEFEIHIFVFHSVVAVAADREWMQSGEPSSSWPANAARSTGDRRESPEAGRALVLGRNREKRRLRVRDSDTAGRWANHGTTFSGRSRLDQRGTLVCHRSASLSGSVGFGESQSGTGESGTRTREGSVCTRRGVGGIESDLQTRL